LARVLLDYLAELLAREEFDVDQNLSFPE